MNKEVISTANAPKAIGPYEQAIKVGEFVYASGQIPLDPKPAISLRVASRFKRAG